MNPYLFLALYHFTVPFNWFISSDRSLKLCKKNRAENFKIRLAEIMKPSRLQFFCRGFYLVGIYKSYCSRLVHGHLRVSNALNPTFSTCVCAVSRLHNIIAHSEPPRGEGGHHCRTLYRNTYILRKPKRREVVRVNYVDTDTRRVIIHTLENSFLLKERAREHTCTENARESPQRCVNGH